MASSPNSGLVKYANTFLEDFSKDPAVQREVHKGTSTEPKRLQAKREILEVIYKFVSATIEQLRDSANPLSPEESQKAYLTAMLASQAGALRALGLIVDCLSIEYEQKVRRDGKIVEAVRRIGLADVIDETIVKAEKDRDKDREGTLVIQNMLHDIGMQLNPKIFEWVDKNGVLLAADKYAPKENEKERVADSIIEEREDYEALTEEQLKALKKKTIDSVFGGVGNEF